MPTNIVLDNVMYCDKFRRKLELAGAIRTAYGRAQEREEFRNWMKYILLSVCGNKEAVVEEILSWAGDGEDEMAFQYNIIRAFEEERDEGKGVCAKGQGRYSEGAIVKWGAFTLA